MLRLPAIDVVVSLEEVVGVHVGCAVHLHVALEMELELCVDRRCDLSKEVEQRPNSCKISCAKERDYVTLGFGIANLCEETVARVHRQLRPSSHLSVELGLKRRVHPPP